MVDDRQQVLNWLKNTSVRVAEPGHLFTLASGEKSPFYIDVKKTMLHHNVHRPLARLLFEALAPFGRLESVAAVAVGGCHLASIVAFQAGLQDVALDVIMVRSEPKGHGMGNQLDRPIAGPGGRVVLLEDVVTTGGSSVKAAKVLRDAGYDVRGVLAVVDRRTTRSPALGDDLPIQSIYTLDDFADMLKGGIDGCDSSSTT